MVEQDTSDEASPSGLENFEFSTAETVDHRRWRMRLRLPKFRMTMSCLCFQWKRRRPDNTSFTEDQDGSRDQATSRKSASS